MDTLGRSAAETEQTPDGHSADVKRLLRQQAALARFGSFAFRETDLLKILNEAARICAECLNVPFCKVCRYRSRENDLLIEAGCGWDRMIGRVVSPADRVHPRARFIHLASRHHQKFECRQRPVAAGFSASTRSSRRLTF